MMNAQVKTATRGSRPTLELEKNQRFVHDDVMTEQLGSSRMKFVELCQALKDKDYKELQKLNELPPIQSNNLYCLPPRYSHDSRSLLHFELSRDDASSVASEISFSSSDSSTDDDDEYEEFEDIWNDDDYGYHDDYNDQQKQHMTRHGVTKSTWNIHIYNRNHSAGDTVWCRVSFQDEFRELENEEILDFVAAVVRANPRATFHVTTTNMMSVMADLFEAHRICVVLNVILDRSHYHDGIVIPNKALLFPKRKVLRQKKTKKRCFLSWLFWSQSGGGDDGNDKVETKEI